MDKVKELLSQIEGNEKLEDDLIRMDEELQIDFLESIRALAGKYGIELEEFLVEDETDHPEFQESLFLQVLNDIMEE